MHLGMYAVAYLRKGPLAITPLWIPEIFFNPVFVHHRNNIDLVIACMHLNYLIAY